MDARTNIESTLRTRHVTEGLARAVDTSVAAAASSEAINAALHLSAVEFDMIDAGEIFKKTPYAAGLKPAGRYVAKDMREVGGIPLLMKSLLDNGHLRGDCITATGRTIAENLKSVKPMAVTDGVVGLKGHFAPEGAVVQVADMSKRKFGGPVRCFDREGAVGPLNVKLTDANAREHETKWHPGATNQTLGALWNARQVGPAVDGAVFHPGGAHEKQCYADI